jgi:aryl-alcohol dehydrogenase-like predicted oxidoreductase
MRPRVVGRSGLQVCSLTLGTLGWGQVIDDDDARVLTETYVEAGGTTFATAAGDGDGAAEETLGRLLDDVVPRRDTVLISRAGGVGRPVDASRGALLGHLDDTLGRLRTPYVDLWLAPGWSEEVPLEETLSALEHAVTSGRARYVGVAGFAGWQLARAYSLLESARVPLVADALEYSLLRRGADFETAPAAQHLGAGVLAGAPLARGVLTGKYRHTIPASSRGATAPALLDGYLDDPSRAVVEAVCIAADGLAITPAEVALRWVLARPGVASALVGARTPGQLRALTSAPDEPLPAQVTDALDDVSG